MLVALNSNSVMLLDVKLQADTEIPGLFGFVCLFPLKFLNDIFKHPGEKKPQQNNRLFKGLLNSFHFLA